MPTDPQRARELFLHAVGKLPPEQWDAYVAEACGPDTELKGHVLHLLKVHREAGSFLERPAAGVAATGVFTPAPGAAAAAVPSEAAGTAIGPYKLLEALGEGGMGMVWMAQQTAPVKRLVALKIIKAGMDSKPVLARFEAERQALALMDHPHIARVLDGGTTAAGRPYFVMELIKGVPITRYCDDHRLTPRQRLELFIPVCQAIQHAHQKGVIHRDVKPSNVLVALYDGKPVPKVIDFGIAKAIGQPLTEQTLVTGFGNVVGTLEYMSPEQAELNQLDIDTRSDVYSLGVLLYELLTGTTPLDRKRLGQAALLEVLRVIREEEPPRPSVRLSSTAEMPSIAANRGLEPRQLSGLVRGELDWLVMKALDKDRNRRYESANGLARDVQRYLADEPVQAWPPSAWYRCRKFARRNKGRLAFAAGACLLAAAVLGVAAWAVRDRAVREEEKQREQAARQARAANELELALERAELFQKQGKRAEVLGALERADVLASEAPADPTQDGRRAALKERLDAEQRDQEFMARFEDIRLSVFSQVNVQTSHFNGTGLSEIRDALARYGITVGAGSPARAAAILQGRPEPVRAQLVAALDRCLKLEPEENTQTRQWLLATLAAADTDAWRSRVRRVVLDGDLKALESLAREVNVRAQSPDFLVELAEIVGNHSRPLRVELLRQIQRAYPADLWANHDLGMRLAESGRPAEGIRYYTVAIALRPKNPGIYVNRGFALLAAGEVDEAIADFQHSLSLAPPYAEAHHGLGNALYAKGRLEQAVAEHREAIRLNKDHSRAHCSLGVELADLGRLDEAITEYRQAIQLEDSPFNHCNLGNLLYAKGRLDEAIAEYRETLRLNKDYAEAHYSLGNALKDTGRRDEAIAEYREAIRIKKDYPEARTNLGSILYAKGQLDEAEAEFREALHIKTDLPEAHNNLGNVLKTKGRLDEAISERREAIRLKKDFSLAHYNLGNDLRAKGGRDEAVAEYREAVRLKPDYAEAHCNLGHLLREKGRFREALEAMRRGHELGSRDPHWPYPSAQWVRQCERLVELDGKLPSILEGKATPAGPGEGIELAGLCTAKRLHCAAARFYEEAFVAEPKLATDPGAFHRYHAACAAVLAGCGRGEDAGKVDGAERARLRRQALDWLRADLQASGLRLDQEGNQPGVAAGTNQVLQRWLADADLAGVRGPAALARLPEAERQAWQTLWGDVATTLARTRKMMPPEKRAEVVSPRVQVP